LKQRFDLSAMISPVARAEPFLEELPSLSVKVEERKFESINIPL
jgi:hypothetical protein